MTPLITIFVRHSSGCKYAGDEFSKRCNCRKHFRWTQNGTQYRRKAGARSWEEAERTKRELEDQLSGRNEAKPEEARRGVQDVEPINRVLVDHRHHRRAVVGQVERLDIPGDRGRQGGRRLGGQVVAG